MKSESEIRARLDQLQSRLYELESYVRDEQYEYLEEFEDVECQIDTLMGVLM